MTKNRNTSQPTNRPAVDNLKRVAERVLQLAPDAPFHSVETYQALQPLRLALTHALAELLAGCSDGVRGEIDRLRRLEKGMRSRKYKGSGTPDTAEETWEQMRAAAIAGEPLRSVAARFGVLLSATVNRAQADGWHGKPWRDPPVPSAKVIQLFPGKESR